MGCTVKRGGCAPRVSPWLLLTVTHLTTALWTLQELELGLSWAQNNVVVGPASETGHSYSLHAATTPQSEIEISRIP